jgi:hypothetical protein
MSICLVNNFCSTTLSNDKQRDKLVDEIQNNKEMEIVLREHVQNFQNGRDFGIPKS